MKIQDRLLAKIDKKQDSGCWEWTGSKCRKYGTIGINGRTVRAHRASYEAFKGQIPHGLNVLHRCDNPPCINPEHLFLGTQLENIADRVAKGRTRSGGQGRRDGTNYPTKLTEADAREILSSRESSPTCAAKYGISPKLVRLIRAGKSWAYLHRGA